MDQESSRWASVAAPWLWLPHSLGCGVLEFLPHAATHSAGGIEEVRRAGRNTTETQLLQWLDIADEAGEW
jgi:hypothetical protein